MLYHAGLRVADFIMVYISLYFGWKGAHGNRGVISSLLTQYVAAHKPSNAYTHGPESFEAYQFADDGGFDEPALGLRPWMCVKIWENGKQQSIGAKSPNREKKRVEGQYSTQALMWGIHVDTQSEVVALPPDKILKAQLLLSNPLFDAGITRLAINLIQKLRGKMEFWSSRCHHIRTECNVVDRILSSKNGYSFHRGHSVQAKRAFAEFWGSVGYLRSLFGSPGNLNAPFRSSFLNVLSIAEQLSFQETRRNLIWIGSDATMDKCGSIDFFHKFYTVFPTDIIPPYVLF